MSYETLLYEVEDGILTLTMNRPDKLNAYNATMREESIAALDRADRDDAVKAIIVTGAGRAFCAGADLSAGGGAFDAAQKDFVDGEDRLRDGGGRMTLRMYDMKKPIIGAINGPAVGIGVTMQLAMDIRLASTKARFGFVFSRRGLVMEACSSWFLTRLVDMGQAQEWVLTGRIFDAEEAKAGGLVRSIHEPDDLLPAARALAREIADNTSGVSVALCRQMLWKMAGADHPMEAHKIDSRGIRYMGANADAREGIQSFLEKRPAKFAMKPSSEMPEWYPFWKERTFE